MLIVDMPMPKSCPCDLIGVGYDLYCSGVGGIPARVKEYYECMENGTRPDWCPIKGVLPEENGDLIDRHKTAEELNEMADEVYNDFPLVDRETLASWDHGIRMAAQYVQNLAGRKDTAERKDDEHHGS